MMQMLDDNTLQIESVLFSDESTFTLPYTAMLIDKTVNTIRKEILTI